MARAESVMIVDDDEHIRVLLRQMVEDAGISKIWEAADGQDAVTQILEKRPDVIFLDLHIPRKNGAEVLAEIFAAWPEAVFYVITSVDSQDLVDESLEAGARGFIAKPFDTARIHRALDMSMSI